MRRLFIFLSLFGLLLTINQTSADAKTFFDIPVEVIEVKDLGLSDRDESKSVIEVRWQINPNQKEKIVAFNVILSVRYADGTTINEKQRFEKSASSARMEVPSVKTFGGKPSAFIKQITAKVTAVISKN